MVLAREETENSTTIEDRARLLKIVIEVQMSCDKHRSKALELAVMEDGLISVAFKRENRNQMEIIGEGIYDVIGLVESLRNKVGHAELVSLGQVMEEIDNKIELKKYKESSSCMIM